MCQHLHGSYHLLHVQLTWNKFHQSNTEWETSDAGFFKHYLKFKTFSSFEELISVSFTCVVSTMYSPLPRRGRYCRYTNNHPSWTLKDVVACLSCNNIKFNSKNVSRFAFRYNARFFPRLLHIDRVHVSPTIPKPKFIFKVLSKVTLRQC
jgi:hypothetical protein